MIMVRHVVTFQFSGSSEVRRTVAASFRDALLALPAQIPQLKKIEVGINENPAENWDLVLIAGHKAARACVDYTIDE